MELLKDSSRIEATQFAFLNIKTKTLWYWKRKGFTPTSELRQLKNTADLEKTNTGRSLTNEEYLSLLLSAEISSDQKFAIYKPKYYFFSHDIVDHHEDLCTTNNDY
jgi:hypothetical protein